MDQGILEYFLAVSFVMGCQFFPQSFKSEAYQVTEIPISARFTLKLLFMAQATAVLGFHIGALLVSGYFGLSPAESVCEYSDD